MLEKDPSPLSTSRIDHILHAIALAMARRQMEKAWPSASYVAR